LGGLSLIRKGDFGPITVAVIGAGYWGKKIIREILEIARTTGKVSLHSVVDNSPTMLAQCNQEFGALDYRLDYRQLIDDPSVDAIYVNTPNKTHFEIASAFIESGKNVSVEKPMTLSSVDAFHLVDLARKNNVVLSSGQIHRFSNGLKELKKAIGAHALGDVYYIRLAWTGFLPPQTERDVITDLAPHPLDICNYLLDEWPVQISCRGKGYRTKGNEEVAFITAEYSAGLAAQIEVSWLDREKRRDVTVVGSKGMAYLDCSEQSGLIRTGGVSSRVAITPSNTLNEMILHFLDNIESNRRSERFSNRSSGILAANVVRLIEASRESLTQGRIVLTNLPAAETIDAMDKDDSRIVVIEAKESKNGEGSDRVDYWVDSGPYDSAVVVMAQAVEARVRGSKHRTEIMTRLGSSDKAPKDLANEIGLDMSNLGKYLHGLVSDGLVVLKTPSDVRKGKLYGLTNKGRLILQRLAGDHPRDFLEERVR